MACGDLAHQLRCSVRSGDLEFSDGTGVKDSFSVSSARRTRSENVVLLLVKLYRTTKGDLIEDSSGFHTAGKDLLEKLFRSAKGEVSQILASRGEQGEAVEFSGQSLAPVPLDAEIWAAGVTYLRSKSARMEESEGAGGDVFYDLVYDADRPELFFKAMGYRASGHQGQIRVREDSAWDVPEPELTLAINSAGEIFGFTIGNDVSSRSIEGENPLYLPQAKVYKGSCAVGPCIMVGELEHDAKISLEIHRAEEVVFSGSTDLTQLKRSLEELVEYLYRELDFPNGALLMTGTGVVPGTNFTLTAGDVVKISIQGIGELENTVE